MSSPFMHAYPHLSAEDSARLPKLTAPAKPMPAKFDDSTHQLWHCETTDGPMVLKVCNQTSLIKSPFWQGMNHLFAANFPAALNTAKDTYAYIAQHGTLAIPGCVTAQSGFVLSRFLEGADLSADAVSNDDVAALANHLARLHQQTQSTWGAIGKAAFSSGDWGNRLVETLQHLAQHSATNIPEQLLKEVCLQASNIQLDQFVPIMPDLRWDQCRRLVNGDIALIDLDAIVIGPAALDLLTIEYQLDKAQYAIFKSTYTQQLSWPNFQPYKQCYQLLLFLMQILGETDINQWMRAVPAAD